MLTNNQGDLFSAEHLRDVGIQNALNHANRVVDNWGEKAFAFFLEYLKNNKEFMAEDVRNASVGIVPEAAHARAWGAIIVRAVKSGLIRRKGFKNVKNAKAHCTPAALWERVKE